MMELTVKKLLLLIVLSFNTVCFGNTILERKVVIPKGKFDSFYVHPLNIFLSKDGRVSILIYDQKNLFLYTNNNLSITAKDREKYFINAFMENDRVKFVYCPILEEIWPGTKSVDIYDVLKGLDKPETSIELTEDMQDELPGKLVTVPQMPGKYYIINSETKYTVAQFIRHVLSGGHGYGYNKPYLAEVDKGRISRYKKIKYGGKRVENFGIAKYIIDTDLMHCLGFRHEPGPSASTVNMYYAGYNLQEKRVTQTANVYELIGGKGFDNKSFGPWSMTCKGDKVFVVLSLYKVPSPRELPLIDYIKQNMVDSNIYYFQHDGQSTTDAVKIAEGFSPLVRLDSDGNVYVFRVDYKGRLIMKKKKKNEWSDDEIVLTKIDVLWSFVSERYKCINIEFDDENNLHIVFPSNDNIVYAKIKLDSIFDKQN
jgi:hypothetical protein